MNNLKELLEKYNVNITLCEIVETMSSVGSSQCDYIFDKIMITIQRNKIIIYDIELEEHVLVLSVLEVK